MAGTPRLHTLQRRGRTRRRCSCEQTHRSFAQSWTSAIQYYRGEHPCICIGRFHNQDLGYRYWEISIDPEAWRYCPEFILECQRYAVGYDLSRQEASNLGCSTRESCT